MMNSLRSWRARWGAFFRPIDPEKAAILRSQWESLPPELKTHNQVSGKHLTYCGFITGASYCSFRCTHCYLPENANAIPIPDLAEMFEQIDANRRFQGPGGGLQITGGDVVDAYWRAGRSEELVRIIRYAVGVGLVPMLMTHGQTLLEQPRFLEELVVSGGLRQIAVHIDVTQRGRAGRIRQRQTTELELNPIREEFTRLVRAIRARTGLPLELAHNCTVTEANLGSIPDLVRWFLADAERTLIWRILSFLPEADTGRTIFSGHRATPQQVWEAICAGLGAKISGHTLIGGHPDCNQGATLLVSRRTGKFMPMTFPDRQTEALFAEMLSKLGGISTMTTDADPMRTAGKSLLAWRVAGGLARHPLLVGKVAFRLVALVANRNLPLELSLDLLRGQAHTVTLGMHNFMDAAAVAQAESDSVVRTRLQACVFKGAVRNGTTGEWETVPMCLMNHSRWREVFRRTTAEKRAGGRASPRADS